MSFSKKILVGLLTGIAAGIVLGDYVAPLALIADGFVRLLQMTVLPYVTVSIVLSVGSLDAAQAKRLGLRAGLAIAGLWVVALIFAFLFPLVFPPAETASFFSTSLIEAPAAFDFVEPVGRPRDLAGLSVTASGSMPVTHRNAWESLQTVGSRRPNPIGVRSCISTSPLTHDS